jgi:Flp pilus assembly protein protease CpaA
MCSNFSGDDHEMVLIITMSTIASFVFTTCLLFIYAVLDIRTRKVPNQVVLIGGIVGLSVVLVFGHIIDYALLHLTAALFSLILGYALFRIGAFGGADVKVLFTITIISPGTEFGSWGNPILEGILVVGLQLVITLAVGYAISQRKPDETEVIPLIPLLLGAYLVLQLLALF